MEFLLAEEANEEADRIQRAERDPASGADPDRAQKQQACRAYFITEIGRFLGKHSNLSQDARRGVAFRMKRALDIAKPYGYYRTGDLSDLVKKIAGE